MRVTRAHIGQSAFVPPASLSVVDTSAIPVSGATAPVDLAHLLDVMNTQLPTIGVQAQGSPDQVVSSQLSTPYTPGQVSSFAAGIAPTIAPNQVSWGVIAGVVVAALFVGVMIHK